MRTTMTLTLTDEPSALARVLSVLARRGCRVRSVDFEAGDRHRPGHLVVAVDGPAARSHCLGRWVANLVDVVDVEVEIAGCGARPVLQPVTAP